MTHCTMDELLALRANEGSVWARQHLEACPLCRGELEAVYQRAAQLKALPSLSPARDRWPVIRAKVLAAQAARRRRWALSGLAAAAVLAGVLVLQPRRIERGYATQLAQAKQQSASLEAALQDYDPSSRVETGRAAALAAALEDRIAAVDAELGQLNGGITPDDRTLVQLWQDRVDLMQQLVDVHVTRAAYVGL
jgi:hypothetical protein